MHIRILTTICLILCQTTTRPHTRQWIASDGLSTGEVRQIVPLPNRQMLVNCEGVFCISNGAGFSPVPCDRRRTLQLKHYADSVGYGHLWQGDSLLWLRDFYRIYLFDMRTRSFRYDIEGRTTSLGSFQLSPTTVSDWQSGTWTGTIGNGIIYTPPVRPLPATIDSGDTLVARARKAANLDVPLDNERRLQCRGLNQLGYVFRDQQSFIPLNERLPRLNRYRHIVGACPMNDCWVVLYTQNGACLLNTQADTLATFAATENIEKYTDKYNCMVAGRDGCLWVGTQDGLFSLTPTPKRHSLTSSPNGEGEAYGKEGNGYFCERVTGLSSNCIRSLVMDAQGNIWAGTACGISRITPTVINYGEDDGIPSVSMMERAACLTNDGRLVFVHHSSAATVFRPEWLNGDANVPPPVLTLVQVNGHDGTPAIGCKLTLSHNENYLSFHFSSLDYARPSRIRYRYRLTGLEDDWHQITQTDGQAIADYTALRHGNYVFEAQAAAADGQWSKALTQAVTIRPPLWLTWWAKLCYGLMGAMGIMGVMGMYVRHKRKLLERENDNRVNHLFELREEARHQFADNTNIDPKQIGVNAEEEVLVGKLLAAIEAHIADEDYGVEQLAADVALSRTNLYAKLRNMLGISPADFIRDVRLKHAATLLADTTLSIGEIADRVGFATSRTFSTHFKRMFGVLPSEYRSSSI